MMSGLSRSADSWITWALRWQMPDAATLLAEASCDDLVFRWLLPDSRGRATVLRR
jgi:hypothetical protein